MQLLSFTVNTDIDFNSESSCFIMPTGGVVCESKQTLAGTFSSACVPVGVVVQV